MDKNKLNDLINKKNFLGAYSVIKNSSLARVDKDIELGKLANFIIKDLSFQKDSEEKVFYKSLLFLIAKDFPGLQESYKIQQRMLSPSISLSSLNKGIQTILDVQSGRKSIYEGFADSSEVIKEVFSDNMEILNQKIQDPKNQAKIIDDIADGINNGLKNLTGIFDMLEGKNRKK